MLFGPEKVLACPHCGSLARTPTLLSGNTFGAIRWTDGKLLAPMLPQMPVVHRCEACRGYFWLADARVIGRIELDAPEEAPPDWRAAPAVEELDVEGYLEALEAGLGDDPARERELRVLAWWTANDAYRAPDPGWKHPGPLELSSGMEANLRRLLSLLDAREEEDRLMIAEVARHLGDFNRVEVVLDSPWDDRYQEAVDRIRGLARARDRLVRPI